MNDPDIIDFLRDLKRTLESQAWLRHLVVFHPDTAAWSWTVATMGWESVLNVRNIQKRGGLLLIGGLYREMDSAAGGTA